MLLAIDVGNTNSHLGIFFNGKLIRDIHFQTDELENSTDKIKVFLKRQENFSAGISSVVPEKNIYLDKLLKINYGISPVFINGKINLPVNLKVLNLASLGPDRICNAVAGFDYFKRKRNVIVIDCGTAITYDVVLKNGDYEGGAISPGLNTLALSLNQYTSRLPLLTKSDFKIKENPVGKHTLDALNSGIVNAFIDSVNGMVSRINKHYKTDFKVIITGGDAKFIMKKLNFRPVVMENCVLQGINIIMKELV